MPRRRGPRSSSAPNPPRRRTSAPPARKAGAAAKTPEQFQAEVAERARRLRERFGAIRSATQADDKPAEPVGEAPKPAEAPTEPEPEKAMDESPAATVNLNGDDAVLRPESPDEADAISAATLDDDGFEPAAKTVEEPSQPEPTPVRRISVAPKLSATPPPADAAETDVAGVAARAAAQAVSDRLERHQRPTPTTSASSASSPAWPRSWPLPPSPGRCWAVWTSQR